MKLCMWTASALLALAGCNSSTSPSDGGGDTGATVPCAPHASCSAGHTCLSLVDNGTAAQFGLRVSQLTIHQPSSFASGSAAQILAGAVLPSNATCNLEGTATTNWLLKFDTGAGTLTLGAAHASTSASYALLTTSITAGATFAVQPVSSAATLDTTGMFTSAGVDVILPAFLDAAGSAAIVLPMKHVVVSGQVSADHNCIGTYNAAGLDPANSCLGDSTHPTFVTGGHLTGYISLEDADTVTIASLQESLCAVLAGGGDMAQPVAHCVRNASNQITFQGDWCAATNAAATATCADSVAFNADLAASAVTIQ